MIIQLLFFLFSFVVLNALSTDTSTSKANTCGTRLIFSLKLQTYNCRHISILHTWKMRVLIHADSTL